MLSSSDPVSPLFSLFVSLFDLFFLLSSLSPLTLFFLSFVCVSDYLLLLCLSVCLYQLVVATDHLALNPSVTHFPPRSLPDSLSLPRMVLILILDSPSNGTARMLRVAVFLWTLLQCSMCRVSVSTWHCHSVNAPLQESSQKSSCGFEI